MVINGEAGTCPASSCLSILHPHPGAARDWGCCGGGDRDIESLGCCRDGERDTEEWGSAWGWGYHRDGNGNAIKAGDRDVTRGWRHSGHGDGGTKVLEMGAGGH